MTENRNLSDNIGQTRNQMLERRMLVFAANIIRELQNNSRIPRPICDQLTRSSASIGANYAEACNAASRQDFRNKIFIAKKEAGESRYWIDLCIELSGEANWPPLRQEAHELLVILQTIINTLKAKSSAA
jgi:four helix bundle protein